MNSEWSTPEVATAQAMCEAVAEMRREVHGWEGTPEEIWAAIGNRDLSGLIADYAEYRFWQAIKRGNVLQVRVDDLGNIEEREVALSAL